MVDWTNVSNVPATAWKNATSKPPVASYYGNPSAYQANTDPIPVDPASASPLGQTNSNGFPLPGMPGGVNGLLALINAGGATADSNASSSVAGPSSTPYPTYSGPSGAEMAKNEFTPQYAALQSIVDAAKERYGYANTDVGNMYDALSKFQHNQTAGIQANYNATGNKLNAGYATAANDTAARVTKNQSEVAQMLARLGIGQAAPQAIGSQSENLAFALGDLAKRQTAQTGFNTSQGQNEVDYNNRNADTTALVGKNQQALLGRQYLAAQQGYDQQRLGLAAGQAAATNKYGMSILGLQQTQQDNQYKQAQLDLEANKFAHQTTMDQDAAALAQQKAFEGSGDAYSIVGQKASELYGAGSPEAGTAMDTITRAYQTMNQNDVTPDLSSFIKFAQYEDPNYMSYTPQDKAKLAQLATLWWSKIGNKAGTQQYGPKYQ